MNSALWVGFFECFERFVPVDLDQVPVVEPARRTACSSMRNPSGPTRCSGDWVAPQVRAIAPVLGGISGSTKTT